MTAFEQGTVAVVTGASRGIGRAVAAELAQRGAVVVVNWMGRGDLAATLVDEIGRTGGQAVDLQADVSCEPDVRHLFREVKQRFGRLDVLVNNAGVIDDGHAMMMSLAKWQRVIDTNLTGVFLCSREALKMMSYANGGAIVNVSSVSSLIGTAGQANYAASKGAVNSLTKTLAREGGRTGIRVNAVAPGYIETDMARGLPAAHREAVLRAVPLQRTGSSEDVAQLVAFLASSDAAYITGQTIAVDGGLT